MKSAARSGDKAVVEITDWVETQDVVTEEVLENYLVDTDVDSSGSELFDVLVGLTAGEAVTVVRGAEGMSGSLAWRRLCERFMPNTPAKALALMMEVMSPKLETARCAGQSTR